MDQRPLAAVAALPVAPPGPPTGRLPGWLEDAVLITLSILAIPTAVLLVGMPVALAVRALIWLAAQL